MFVDCIERYIVYSTCTKLIDEIVGKFVEQRGLVRKCAVARIGNVGTGMEGEVGEVAVSRSIFVVPTEAQKGRLTSVTDVRSRFDPWRKKRGSGGSSRERRRAAQ